MSFLRKCAAGAGSPLLSLSSPGSCKAFRPLVALLGFWLTGLLAPPGLAAADEWLPIAPEDLALKANPASPGSHAMILYSDTQEDLRNRSTFYYLRIKIFDDEGLKYAEVQAVYGDDRFSVEGLHARTIHPDGSIVNFSGEPVRMRKRSINGSQLLAAFTCPAATAGSIVEYMYRIQFHPGPPSNHGLILTLDSDSIQLMTQSIYFDWAIPRELFIRYARYTLLHGDVFAPSVPGNWIERPGLPRYRVENLPTEAAVVTEKPGKLVCEARDVAPAPDEAFPPPQHKQRVRIELYFVGHKKEPPETFWGRYAALEQTWDSDTLRSLKLARRIVEQAAEKRDTREATLRKLYARAHQIRNRTYRIEPEERTGKSEPLPMNQTAENVLKRGEGTSGEINLAFLALARAAGFDAGLIRLAPRSRGRFNPDLYDWSQLSQNAVWVRLGDTEMVLDPGTPFCPYGMLPWPKVRAGGFRFSKSSDVQVTTPGSAPPESRIERKGELQLSMDGSLQGSMAADFYGQRALELRIELLGMGEEERNRTLTEHFVQWLPPGARIESLKAVGWNSDQDPLHVQFQVFIPPQPGTAGSVGAALTATVAGQKNPFENPERIQAVSFPYTYQETDEITIALPQGAHAGQLPPREARLRLPGQIISEPENGESTGLRRRQPGDLEVAAYQNLRKEGEHSIIVTRTLLVGITDLPVEHYAKLREFFQQVQAGDAESLILRASRE